MSLLGLVLAFYGIWNDYSYWIDELFSVTASESTFFEMFDQFIFVDVHPPLYQVVLYFWIRLFGSTEPATRALSLLFSFLALLIFAWYLIKNAEKKLALTAIAFFATNNLFIYYAQETRSYAMMLFLATIVTLLSVEKIRDINNKRATYWLFLFAILLSNTHYFGLFYTGFILFFLLIFLKNFKERLLVVIAGFLSILYFVVHFAARLANRTGGNFWIQSDGIQSTISTFALAMLPQFNLLKRISAFEPSIISILAVIAFFAAAIYTYKKVKDDQVFFYKDQSFSQKSIFDLFLFLVIGFILFTIFVDLHTPISTNRNYIVLLPVVSLLFAYFFASFPVGRCFSIIVFLVLSYSLRVSYKNILSKQFPIQNNKGAVAFIERNSLLRNRTLYSNLPPYYVLFYFKEKPAVSGMMPSENLYTIDKDGGFVYLSMHTPIDIDELLDRLKKEGFQHVNMYNPPENYEGSTYVIWADAKN